MAICPVCHSRNVIPRRTGRKAGGALGGVAGAAGGAASSLTGAQTWAAFGAFAGPVGIALGGLAGALLGGLVGAAAGSIAGGQIGDVVDHVYRSAGEFDEFGCFELVRPDAAVVVAAHGGERRNGGEFRQHRIAADIACMQDVIDAGERFGRFRAHEIVRVGNQADDERACRHGA